MQSDDSIAPSSNNNSAKRSWVRRNALKLGLSGFIAFAFCLILRRGGLPIVPEKAAFENVKWWTCGGYAVTFFAWSTIRAVRSRHLLRAVEPSITVREIVTISFIGFLAIFTLPLRLGEVVRPALFNQKSRISFATATGVMGAERIIDGLTLMILLGTMLPLGRPLNPLPNHIGNLPIPVVAVPAAAYTSLLVFIAAFAAMALFYWRRAFARDLTERVIGVVSKRLAQLVANQVEKLSEGFRFLPSAKHIGPYLLETLVYWLVSASGMLLLAWGCGIRDITLPQIFAVMGVLGIGIIAPGAPGYFGAFQASLYAGLALYFGESVVFGPGSAYVFLLYVLQLGGVFVIAIFALLLDKDIGRQAANAQTWQKP
jgi:hypothetical protein